MNASSKISIKDYTPDQAGTWDQIVSRARNGTFLHLRGFMDYHSNRFEDCSAIIYRGKNPMAVFPANRRDDIVISHEGLTFGGLIYGFELRADGVHDAFSALLEYYRSKGLSQLYYKPVPHIYHQYPAEEDLYSLFLHDARLVRRDLSSILIPAKKPSVSKSRKHGIKRAKSLGLKYSEGTFFESFHALLSEVLLRHNARPVHSVSELSLLQSRFPENICLGGTFDGEDLLAATWIFKFNEVKRSNFFSCF